MDTYLLETSLELVDDEQGLTTRFYEILFDRHPAVRPMFGTDIRPQAAMLRGAIVAVLDHLDDAEWLASTLGALGAKHAAYGATPAMFDAVAECMIAAMEERGGAAWTPEMTNAWTEALSAVAGLMLDGYPETESVAV